MKRKRERPGRAARDGRGLLRRLYDAGSALEIKAERGVVKLAKALSGRLWRKK